MAAPLIKTKTPGIYKRGSRYVFSYRDATGKQRWESCRTLDEARRRKRNRETSADDGERAETNDTLTDYARAWIKTYNGRTRRGFRAETRREYQRQIESYLLRYPIFDGRLLKQIGPRELQGFVAWLERDQQPQLADATVQRIMAPIKAMFATAYELEDLRRNPATRVRLSNRDEAKATQDDETAVKAMTAVQLDAFLRSVDDRWRTFFQLLAVTGIRISEAIGLEWRHVQLTGSEPHIKIRQRIVKGKLGAPKSTYGRRDIPIPQDVVLGLLEARRASEWPRGTDPVFPSLIGTPLSASNLLSRVLKPAADAADIPWIGFHTFRHTCASMLIAQGRNILQTSRWLGHHDPGFTLRRYGSLMDDGVGPPLEIGRGVNKVQTCPTPSDGNGEPGLIAESSD